MKIIKDRFLHAGIDGTPYMLTATTLNQLQSLVVRKASGHKLDKGMPTYRLVSRQNGACVGARKAYVPADIEEALAFALALERNADLLAVFTTADPREAIRLARRSRAKQQFDEISGNFAAYAARREARG